MTLVAAASLAGWAGADLELRAECLAVSWVWPSGPASVGGLAHGDCLTAITLDGKAVALVNALEAIVTAGGGSVLRAQTGAGKRIAVTFAEPTKDALIAHCEWRQARRIKLDVVVFSTNSTALSQLMFDAPPSVQDVRKRVGAAGSPRVDLKADCAARPRKVSGRVTDALIITVDATVAFGEPPASMFVIQDDGGMCKVPAPPYSSDGGLDLFAAETDCASR